MPLLPFRHRPLGNQPTFWRASDQRVPAGVTFARTGAALYLSGASFATAVYASVASDQPRFERLPSGNIGWLGEGQTSNLILQSSDLTNAYWFDTNGGCVQTLNQPGLTGASNTATFLQDADAAAYQSVNGWSGASSIDTAASTVVCTAFILKDATTSRFPGMQNYIGAANHQFQQLNTSTGAVLTMGTVGALVPTVFARDRGLWWEFGWYGTKLAGDTDCNCILYPAQGATLGGDAVTPTGSIVVGHASIAVGTPVRTSPVQTTGTVGTRNAETAPATTGLPPAYGFSAMINGCTAAGVSGDQYFWSCDDGTANNRIALRRNSTGNIVLDVVSGGTAQVGASGLAGPVVADETEFRAAFSIAANSMNLCVGTTLATRDTSCTIPVGMTTLRYHTDHANLNHSQGHIIGGKFGPVWLPQTNDAGLLALCA